MAHEIETRDVQVGVKQAWHGLTKVVEKIDESNARILYGMGIAPVRFTPKFALDENGEQRPETAGNGRQIYSLDDGLPIGKVVSDEYGLITNTQMWEAIQAGLTEVNHEIVSVGTVQDRALAFCSVKVQESFTAARRETESVLNFLWGHGGNRSVIAKTGFTVVVCANTYAAAMSERSDFSLSTKHTKHATLDRMKRAVELHYETTQAFQRAMNDLDCRGATKEEARQIYAGFVNKDGAPSSSDISTRRSNTIEALSALFSTGKGNRGETLADVFNGYTDLMSHGNGGSRSKWSIYASSEFGSGARLKAEFFEVLTDEKKLNDTIRHGQLTLANT